MENILLPTFDYIEQTSRKDVGKYRLLDQVPNFKNPQQEYTVPRNERDACSIDERTKMQGVP